MRITDLYLFVFYKNDAYQSAAAIEQEGFKSGPLGSRGLGQPCMGQKKAYINRNPS